MSAYYLIWNPSKWTWEKYHKFQQGLTSLPIEENWSVNSKKLNKGDTVFLLLVGDSTSQKGIIAKGYLKNDVFEAPHFDKDVAKSGKTRVNATIVFTDIIDTDKGDVLSLKYLRDKYYNSTWRIQSNGASIPNNILINLEKDWQQHYKNNKK
jgi:hypothetical protein